MKTVFVDVDTQLDFMVRGGALYAPGSELLTPRLAALSEFAVKSGIPILSTADAHSEDDPEFKTWKPHCVVGTQGERKLAETSVDRQYIVSTETDSLDPSLVHAAAQIIVQKQNVDCFTNPNLPELLRLLNAERFVVYGVVTEVCVRHAARGLLKTGAKVELVADAIQALDEKAGREALNELTDKGVELTTVAGVLEG
jgi:nicotinamidase/pyrazinamidase